MKPKIGDTIRLTESLPHESLPAGALGTIIVEFEVPDEAYEVEFTDGDGVTTAQVALRPDQFVLSD